MGQSLYLCANLFLLLPGIRAEFCSPNRLFSDFKVIAF